MKTEVSCLSFLGFKEHICSSAAGTAASLNHEVGVSVSGLLAAVDVSLSKTQYFCASLVYARNNEKIASGCFNAH